MRLIKLLTVGLLGIAGVAGFVSSAQAAPVPWTNANGSTADFDWSGGLSDNGLFGDPVVVGNTFLFFPNNFIATSTNGVAAEVSDRLQFDLLFKPNKAMAGFTVNELGDYQITGAGGSVNAGGYLLLANLLTGQTKQDLLDTTPAMPITTPTAGAQAWSGFESISLLPNGWTKVRVVINNVLHATSGANGASTIQKKFVDGAVEITIIVPEPASLSLIGAAGLLLIRRRK